jgi:hypothetical protein
MVEQGIKGLDWRGINIWRKCCHCEVGTHNARSGVAYHLATIKNENGWIHPN